MPEPTTLLFGDPTTAPFWEAARQHRLLIQRCAACGHHQFYPRPFCLSCDADQLAWVEASGEGTIYSMTTVRIAISADFQPPYRVGLVELAEGPRLLGSIIGAECRIGDRVRARWAERTDAPPLVVFEPLP